MSAPEDTPQPEAEGAHSLHRFPPRHKRADGSFGCRGCGGDIPKARQTWCSHECHLLYDPFYVKQEVRRRSGERCEMCGVDCSRKAIAAYVEMMPKSPKYADTGLGWPYDCSAFWRTHPPYLAYVAALKEWKRSRPYPEYDHIIPHSEGGKYTLENIRLLCSPCHRARTSLWRKEKASRLKPAITVPQSDAKVVGDLLNELKRAAN